MPRRYCLQLRVDLCFIVFEMLLARFYDGCIDLFHSILDDRNEAHVLQKLMPCDGISVTSNFPGRCTVLLLLNTRPCELRHTMVSLLQVLWCSSRVPTLCSLVPRGVRRAVERFALIHGIWRWLRMVACGYALWWSCNGGLELGGGYWVMSL